MAFKIEQTEEQPKKSVKIRRIKFVVPNKDYLFLFVILLLIFNFVYLLVTRTVNGFMVGFNAGLILHFLSRNEEMVRQGTKEEKNGSVKAMDLPDL